MNIEEARAEEVRIAMLDGTMIERGLSTTQLTVSEFSELIERVMQYAAEELGVVLT